MSGKLPAFQLYPGDWLRDSELQMASAASRGVWINLLSHMWFARERGELRGGAAQLAKLGNCQPTEFVAFLNEAATLGFADVSQNVTAESVIVTVRNRRMVREEKLRKDDANRQSRRRERLKSGECHAPVTTPSSSPSSSPAPPDQDRAPSVHYPPPPDPPPKIALESKPEEAKVIALDPEITQARSSKAVVVVRSARAPSRLPADFELSAARLTMGLNLGLSETAARYQFDKFRDHWNAKPGRDALKQDWDATWRTWCRRETEGGAPVAFGAARPRAAPPLSAGMQNIADQLAELQRDEGRGRT